MSFKAMIIIGLIVIIFGGALYDGYNRAEGIPLFTVLSIAVYAVGYFIGFGVSILKSCFD